VKVQLNDFAIIARVDLILIDVVLHGLGILKGLASDSLFRENADGSLPRTLELFLNHGPLLAAIQQCDHAFVDKLNAPPASPDKPNV
jgi:hypothetical protein